VVRNLVDSFPPWRTLEPVCSCRATIRSRRMFGIPLLRSAFHSAMAVNGVEGCLMSTNATCSGRSNSLMGGLLHFVQRGGDGAGCGLAQSSFHCLLTKYSALSNHPYRSRTISGYRLTRCLYVTRSIYLHYKYVCWILVSSLTQYSFVLMKIVTVEISGISAVAYSSCCLVAGTTPWIHYHPCLFTKRKSPYICLYVHLTDRIKHIVF